MDRKSFLERLTVIGGCTLVAPTVLLKSCKVEPRSWSGLSSNDIEFLGELAETIIPSTASLPGAKSVGVGNYIVDIVQNCLSVEDQNTFITGLNTLEQSCISVYGNSFEKMTTEERSEFLNAVQEEAVLFNEKQKGLEEPEIHYFSLLKELSISGYFTSKEVIVEGFNYAPIPGKYEGCIDYNVEQDKIYKG